MEIKIIGDKMKILMFVILVMLTFSVSCFGLDFVVDESPENTSVIKLEWTAVADDGKVGERASYYDLRYSEWMITDSTWDEAIQVDDEPMPNIPGLIEFFIVQNLKDNTTYNFAIKVYDDVGNWSMSNVAQATTRDTLPPGEVANLQKVSIEF